MVTLPQLLRYIVLVRYRVKRSLMPLILWQSSRLASFSPGGLTLWPSWLERWLVTLSGLSVQVRIPVGLSEHYIGGSSAGLGKAQRIDSSLRADWLSCFSLAWWEWRVARQGCLVPLRKGGMWQSSRPASFSPGGLTLWPSWLERWLGTLSGLSVQVRIPVGLSGHYNIFNAHSNQPWLRLWLVLPNSTDYDLGHGWLVIISDTLLVVMFYRNYKFNESTKGEWIDIFISFVFVCVLSCEVM